jgi:DNA polymerase-3 subunit delta'
MPGFGDIRGQDRAVWRLRQAVATGRLAHAYLFSGPPGSGKVATALALAAAASCESAPGEGCSTCGSCQKVARGIHPDVLTLRPEGAAAIIPIETIRQEVLARAGLGPHEGRARFILVEEATWLPGPSANALLKILEEPPQRTHFVLCTTAPHQLLPTLRSRCQRIGFAQVPPDVRAASGEDPERAARQSAIVEELLAAAAAAEPQRRDQAALAAAADKDDLAPTLELLCHRLHGQARAAAERGDRTAARAWGRRTQRALCTRFAVTVHNAHPQLALDALLRDLP